MSTLARAEIVTECCRRLERLSPDMRPRWGRMRAPQMVCHLSDSFQAATGEKHASLAPGPLPRGLVRWIALRTPLPWAHNIRTRPEMEQGRGGTPPGDWEHDRQKLAQLILAFPAQTRFEPHPLFGPMNWSDWQIWGYRHVDHHFRQFGV